MRGQGTGTRLGENDSWRGGLIRALPRVWRVTQPSHSSPAPAPRAPDHACATLRALIALRPPSPPYAPYYDAFLRRLRKYIQAAPPGSMERHLRRALLLAAAKATLEGRGGGRCGEAGEGAGSRKGRHRGRSWLQEGGAAVAPAQIPQGLGSGTAPHPLPSLPPRRLLRRLPV
jgi:hypothetical protein